MDTNFDEPILRDADFFNISSELTILDGTRLRSSEITDFSDFLNPLPETTEILSTTQEDITTTMSTTTATTTSITEDLDRLRQEDWTFQFYPRADQFQQQIRRLPDLQYLIQFYWPEFSDIGAYFTYGCNCYFLGEWFYGQLSTPGYGQPVDSHDTVCYDLKQCYQNSINDFGDECRGEFISTKKILSRDRRNLMCGDPRNTCERSLCECDLKFAQKIAERKHEIPDIYKYNLFLNGAALGDESGFHPKKSCKPNVEISQTFSEGHLVQVSEVISGHSVDPAAINCPSVDCWTFNKNEKKCELKPISSCYTLLCDYDKIELEFGENLFAMNPNDELEINHQAPNICQTTFDSKSKTWKFSGPFADCGNEINIAYQNNKQ